MGRGSRIAARRRRPLVAISIALALQLVPIGFVTPAPLARAETPPGDIPMQFVETELSEVARAVSERTGLRLVWDERLRGRVTLTAPRPVSRDEAIELLTSALRLAGFALVRAPGDAYEIVPVAESAGRVPVTDGTPRALVDAPVTTLVPLHAAQAEALLPVLQPLLGSNAVLQAFTPTNTLILSATEAQLQRVILLVRALDRAEARRLVLLRPRFRDAVEILPMLEAAFPESQRASDTLRLFADERSNALLVEGSDAMIDEVRGFLRSLDVPPYGPGGLHVIRIRHADAEELAEVLQQAATPPSESSAAPPAGAEPEISSEALAGREFSLSVDKPTNSLVIGCDEETLRVVAGLIAELDVDAPAVSVRAMLLEVETNDALDVAIDSLFPWNQPDSNRASGFVRFLNSGNPTLLGPQPVDASGDNGLIFRFIQPPQTFTRVDPATGENVTVYAPTFAVDLKALAQATNTRLLSEPQILARSGEEQEIFIGNNIPIVSATESSAAGDATADPLSISQNIERQDVGVTLRVKPNVPLEGPVRLELRVEFSALTLPFAGDPAAVGPTLIEQEVESTIYLDDGTGAVVGVRGQPQQQETTTGTPFLMDVPGLGWMFSSISTRTLRKDLVLAVQVDVIRSPRDLEDESIRRRVAVERSIAGLESLPVNPEEAPFAVWVTSVESREEAEAVARDLDLGGIPARVVAWKGGDPRRFDVYVLGFDRFPDAVRTSLQVRSRGFDTEVVALPGRSY